MRTFERLRRRGHTGARVEQRLFETLIAAMLRDLAVEETPDPRPTGKLPTMSLVPLTSADAEEHGLRPAST